MTAPPKQKKNKGPVKRKRATGRGCAAKRTRARWDAKGYTNRTRAKAGRAGPANAFVVRTDPKIFDKDPRGRKPLSYQQRMEGVAEVEQMMEDAIKQQEQEQATAKAKKKKPKKKKSKPTATPSQAPVIRLNVSSNVSPTVSANPAVNRSGNPGVNPVISGPVVTTPQQMSGMDLQLLHAQYMVQMQMFGMFMNPQPSHDTFNS